MDPITVLAAALGGALGQVANHLIDKGIQEPLLEPATDRLKDWVQRGHRTKKNQALRGAVEAALKQAGAPTEDDDQVTRWLKGVGLDQLSADRNAALRRQVAQVVLGFTDPAADPPEALLAALGWPRSQQDALAALLSALRGQLAGLEDWQALIAYTDRAAERGLLRQVVDAVALSDRAYVQTEAGLALRVAAEQTGLTPALATEIERRYREELVSKFRLHDFRGIAQIKDDTRLPLADIYQELNLLQINSAEERQRIQEQMLKLREKERSAEEERRIERRVTNALVDSPRLVILGEPGAGKTISLHFIALMLAYGPAAARLNLDTPFIPLFVRLAEFARRLQANRALSLYNFMLDYVRQAYDAHPRLGELLHLALDKGACMVLLDGLDEVGDDPAGGVALRGQVVQKVQAFADHWCDGVRCNRIVVTSRIEGYWDDPVRGFDHVQLSPLRPPDEIEAFVLRWYTAHELAFGVEANQAQTLARERVAELLPRIMSVTSVRRLATNPLLLTILALIQENVGNLPNRRIKLYRMSVETLVDSWRRKQTGEPSPLLTELGEQGEELVLGVLASLAYWLHESHPGGTAPYEAWRGRLIEALEDVLDDGDARVIAERLLHHARHEAGLLAERGVGQYGFFHLTFEEYLAARQLARQRVGVRREQLKAHWEDPRWHEVILLTAGQLGVEQMATGDVSDLIQDLLDMEPHDPGNAGRQVVLAGRALADIGTASVTRRTRQWVREALQATMQDRDALVKQPNSPPRLPVRTRYDAGEALDDLGWLPEDLDAWVLCPGCAQDGGDLLVGKYPVTNAQFARFVKDKGYENPDWWSKEGWQWRKKPPSYRNPPVTEPEYWHTARYGQERRGSPVVGVSWYEAKAYCTWLTAQLQETAIVLQVIRNGHRESGGLSLKALAVSLPTETEWVAFSGGVENDRYPWDPPGGPATASRTAILARANTRQTELSGPSPVAMYPLGAGQPYGLMDLAGNVWEWSGDLFGERRTTRALRGAHGLPAKVGCGAARVFTSSRTTRARTSGFGWSPPSRLLDPEFKV